MYFLHTTSWVKRYAVSPINKADLILKKTDQIRTIFSLKNRLKQTSPTLKNRLLWQKQTFATKKQTFAYFSLVYSNKVTLHFLMSGFYMPSKSIYTSSSIFTLPTLILSFFMYWLYVTCKITFRSSYIFTLVTVILCSFMY